MTNKKKPKVELRIECPYCKKAVVVRQYEETTKVAEPAVKKIWITAEKDTQKKLPLRKDRK